MARGRQAYSSDFTDEAVKLVVNTGRPSARVAKGIGVADQTLSRWVKTYRDQVGEVEPISEGERAELQWRGCGQKWCLNSGSFGAMVRESRC